MTQCTNCGGEVRFCPFCGAALTEAAKTQQYMVCRYFNLDFGSEYGPRDTLEEAMSVLNTRLPSANAAPQYLAIGHEDPQNHLAFDVQEWYFLVAKNGKWVRAEKIEEGMPPRIIFPGGGDEVM